MPFHWIAALTQPIAFPVCLRESAEHMGRLVRPKWQTPGAGPTTTKKRAALHALKGCYCLLLGRRSLNPSCVRSVLLGLGLGWVIARSPLSATPEELRMHVALCSGLGAGLYYHYLKMSSISPHLPAPREPATASHGWALYKCHHLTGSYAGPRHRMWHAGCIVVWLRAISSWCPTFRGSVWLSMAPMLATTPRALPIERRHRLACSALAGNANNLPLMVIATMCDNPTSVGGQLGAACQQTGLAYVSFGSCALRGT